MLLSVTYLKGMFDDYEGRALLLCNILTIFFKLTLVDPIKYTTSQELRWLRAPYKKNTCFVWITKERTKPLKWNEVMFSRLIKVTLFLVHNHPWWSVPNPLYYVVHWSVILVIVDWNKHPTFHFVHPALN